MMGVWGEGIQICIRLPNARRRDYARPNQIRQNNMIPIDVLLIFIVASAALAIAPGPDNIFVLTQSAVQGKKAGMAITLGLCAGLIVHITAVVLGVAAIFKTSELAFTILKIVGAMYLLYLAWRAFQAAATQIPMQSENPVDTKALFIRGIIMNITNPKVAIFFLAFLPQFADPSRGAISLQIIELGFIFMMTAFVIFSGIAWAADWTSNRIINSKRTQLVINRLAGTVFLLLACRLALSKQ